MIGSASTLQPLSSEGRCASFKGRGGTSLVALCEIFAVLTTGCNMLMQNPHCPALNSCGGEIPFGDWVLSPGHPSCSEDLYIPPIDTRLVDATLPPARTPPPEPALFDWCILLVTSGGTNIQASPPRFFYESGPIGVATVRYETDGHFSAGITRTGTYTLDFPAYCMRAFGAVDGRLADPANNPNGPPVNICKQLEVPLRASGLGEGSYPNTTCEPNPADPAGCLCAFDVMETGSTSGSYQKLDANTLLHLPNTNFPGKVTFCNRGDSIDLTGSDGQYLFDQPGLRTMNLVRAPRPMP